MAMGTRSGACQRGSGKARPAKLRRLKVQMRDVMGRSHDAPPVEAMVETQDMAQLMGGFLDQALAEQIGIRRETVELFTKAVKGHDGATSPTLGFPKEIGEDGDEKIKSGDSKPGWLWVACEGLHPLKQNGGIVLIPPRVVSKVSSKRLFVDVAGNLKDAR